MSTQLKKHPKTRGFTMVENSVLRNRDLSLRAKGLLTLVLGLPDDAVTSAEALADRATDGVHAIRSTKRELTEHGHLFTERVRTERGQWHTIEHWFEIPQVDFSGDPPNPDGPTLGGSDTRNDRDSDASDLIEEEPVLEEQPLEEQPQEDRTSSSPAVNDPSAVDLDFVFDEWWQTVPKKAGKKKARAIYKRVIRREEATPEQLLTAMRALGEHMRATGQVAFVPHPSTWLNRGGWEEDPVQVYPPRAATNGSGGLSAADLAMQYAAEDLAREATS